MDEKEKKFFASVVQWLEKDGYDTTKEEFMLHSGDNSVYFRGPFVGHSLAGLKTYVAEKMGKKVYYEQEDY